MTEFGSIERDLYIDATPEVVFDVVSAPEHIKDWWSAETAIVASTGSAGSLSWTDEETGRTDSVGIVVVQAQRPRLFSFRWTHPVGTQPEVGNSMLVTFTITASGQGSVLHMTETGFREHGWEVAKLEATYADHAQAWGVFLPRLAARAVAIGASR